MKYLLDSNIISDFYDKDSLSHLKILRKIASLQNNDHLCISVLVLYELEYGLANAPEAKKAVIQQKIIEVQSYFDCLPLTAEAAKLFGGLKKAIKEHRQLKKEAVKKYNIDIMIAASAITEDAVLVSADLIYPEIIKINQLLKLENWTQ